MSSRIQSIQPVWQLPKISFRIAALGMLVSLTIAGLAAGVARLISGMGSTTSLTDVYPWGIWIGFDFAMIALSGAGFTMAAVVHVLHMHRFEAAFRPALFAGLLGYVAVLLLLVLDLGRPDRFYHFILYWNMHSPLFEISWCVLLYTTVLMLEISPDIFKLLRWQWAKRIVHAIMPVVCIIGVTLSSLHQSTLGTLYVNMPHRLNPLWYSAYLPILFFVSAVMAGLSVAILAHRITAYIHRQTADLDVSKGLGTGVIVASLIYGVARLAVVVAEGKQSFALEPSTLALLFWAEMLIAVVIPVLLLVWGRNRTAIWVYWVAPLLVVVGVAMNRFNSTLAAQLPVWQGEYSPHLLEWVSTFGILAGALFLWLIAVRYFVPMSQSHHEA
jgi:Ni/Fe-hydrogenase subunit HybB-like protein